MSLFNLRQSALFMGLSILALSQGEFASAQTFMRQQGQRGNHSALSLNQMFSNLATQQHSSHLLYTVGAVNLASGTAAPGAGIGVRVAREEGPQFSLEYIQGATYLRAQGSGELFSIDLNVPLIGSPVAQTMLQALNNNISQGMRNLECNLRDENFRADPNDLCSNDDYYSRHMDLSNNRQTTGFGLRVLTLAADGQLLHQLATNSQAGSYIILSPSILINLLHVDYQTLHRSGLSSLAIRVGGFPIGFGAGVNANDNSLGAGGTFRADIELVVHLGGGHYIGLEALYRYFGAYHETGGTTLDAIHSLKGALSYSYWPSHTRGTGVGFYARPSYDLNVVDISSEAHPNGQATINQTPALNLGIEF